MKSNLIIKAGKSFYSGIRDLTRSNINGETKVLSSAVKKGPVTDVVNLPKIGTVDLSSYSPEINSKFRELVSILKARKPNQIIDTERYSKILENVFNNPNYKSEKDLLMYLKNLTTFAGKKTPNGKYVLDGKMFAYLADFKANGLSKKQLCEFGDLVTCAEKGLIHPSALQKFNIADGVNPQILRDIEKLKLAKAKGVKPIDVFIPEFESAIKNADEIAKLKAGDLYSLKIGNSGKPETYLVTGNNRTSLLTLDRETLFGLMPPVKRFFVSQNQSGTCYQLASYISMLNEPKFMSKLFTRMGYRNGKLVIKMPNGSTPDNLFAGKFEEFSKEGCVRTFLEHGKFVPKDVNKSVLSNPLVKAMENLYGKHRKYTIADEYVKSVYKTFGKEKAQQAYKEALKNMETHVYVKDNHGNFIIKPLDKKFRTVEDYYKESGTTSEIFKFFNQGFNKVDYYKSGGSDSLSVLNEIRKRLMLPGASHVFGTMPKAEGIESVLNKGKDLYSSHAYCLLGYNSKTDVATYINPWNSTLTYDMKLEELVKYMNTLSSFI